MTRQYLTRAITVSALLSLISACDLESDPVTSRATPQCFSERVIEGWTVAAGLAKAQQSDEVIEIWETRRDFSPDLGLRIIYDTSEGPSPSLAISHNYKSGEFVMRLEDGSHFRLYLKNGYSLSSAPMPTNVFDQMSRHPMQIEHTSSTNKWKTYETSGLPEAIVAATADLDSIKTRLDAKECRA